MSKLLSIKNLRVRFRIKSPLQAMLQKIDDPYIDAVRQVSLDIKQGETFTLVGESGSGKTTLALAVAGLLNATEGQIKFMNEDVTSMTSSQIMAYRKKISFIWQNSIGSLSPRMSVGSLITEGYKIHNLKDRDLKMEADRLLKLVGLPAHISGRYAHQLSGGQARRVGVARAIALKPKLIIADEPTAGLDVSVQGEILNLLNKLKDDLGVSLFVITHNLNIVRHISDKTAVMYLGRFVEQGQTDDIFAKPKHPYTLALLSANLTPYPEASLKNRIELKGEVPSLMDRPNGCEFHTRCPFSSEHCDNEFPPMHVFDGEQILTCHYPLNQN
ncbi:MAG: peptide ABC transporter ATP-binding protein [Candidatus Marinimicrobia bacterium]|nr:peptide ABC transporter ATP-binding protein [Candidatus Neomarinimicrobiota bacterium]|tara:strand:- start:1172 stop:2158 length:987 start_codon:yes stop_codon:yes gene_type:complete